MIRMTEVYKWVEETVEASNNQMSMATNFHKGDIREMVVKGAGRTNEVVFNRIDNHLIITAMDNGVQSAKEGFIDLERHSMEDFNKVIVNVFKPLVMDHI